MSPGQHARHDRSRQPRLPAQIFRPDQPNEGPPAKSWRRPPSCSGRTWRQTAPATLRCPRTASTLRSATTGSQATCRAMGWPLPPQGLRRAARRTPPQGRSPDLRGCRRGAPDTGLGGCGRRLLRRPASRFYRRPAREGWPPPGGALRASAHAARLDDGRRTRGARRRRHAHGKPWNARGPSPLWRKAKPASAACSRRPSNSWACSPPTA